MEFAVSMTCNGCVNSVKKSLQGVEGVKSVQVNLDTDQVIVESSLPSSKVQSLIESTGKRAVLQGYGNNATQSLGAAVAQMEFGQRGIRGIIRLVQTNQSTCVVDGTVDGLPAGKHKLYVHECGDISAGCNSCGDVFGLTESKKEKPLGEIGNIEADRDGRSQFRLTNTDLKVWDIIGRSMVIHQGQDDTPKPYMPQIYNRLVCGIIARSAGLFQNTKKICACDGVTLWDERDKPVAGPGRKSKI
ncbi:hypothetical protein FSP39_020907 [Pinctada imbricata]|uniref:Superoxide dismutase 1 copper chaperone n=1 Tax=Pinctada imbricata TaxID=66713 RepID=A0AA88Y484_PINIB|nr:hypothetical protein FSP39_020907 [Pinctada imbricata]